MRPRAPRMTPFVFSASASVSGSNSSSAISRARSSRSSARSRLAREEHEAADLRSEGCQVRVRLLLGEHRKGAIHALEPLLDASPIPGDLGDARRHSCRRMRGAPPTRRARSRARSSRPPRPAALRPRPSLPRARGAPPARARPRSARAARSNARCASAFAPSERRALGGPDEHLERLRPQLGGVGVLRRGVVGVEVVRGDDLDDLVLLGAPGRGEELRGRQVLAPCARVSRSSRRRRA